MKLILASGNLGKLAELEHGLGIFGLELIGQATLGIEGAQETAPTFIENALLKARHASAASGLPALADDSGLIVDALDGRPGLHSARYAGRHGDHGANTEKLLGELDALDETARGAHFYAVLVLLASPDDPAPLVAEGLWHGRILRAARGSGGFGYDPVFFDSALGLGAAELDPATKHRVSHRGKALTALGAALPAWLARHSRR